MTISINKTSMAGWEDRESVEKAPRIYYIFRLWALFLFVYSMYPWFTLGVPSYIVNTLSAVFFLFIISNKRIVNISPKVKSYLPFALLVCLWLNRYSWASIILGFVTWFCICVLFFLREEFKRDLIRFITKWFSIIVFLSLIAFLLVRAGFPLPYSVLNVDSLYGYGDLNNYYLFISTVRSGGLRFQGLFLEPGHFTMGLAPLLFLNRYDFRDKYVVILLLAQFFTFSLAGYIALVVGILLNISKNSSKHIFIGLIVAVAVIYAFVYSLQYFYDVDIIDVLIYERLEENMMYSGFNRAGESFNALYNKFLQSPDILWGMGIFNSIEGEGSSGFKVFFYVQGIIGILCCIYLYLIPTFLARRPQKKDSLKLFVFLIMMLYQNSYPFWWCMLIVLICGMSYLSTDKKTFHQVNLK